MAGEKCTCNNCGASGVSQLRGSFWISFILFWFFAVIPGIIYMVWRRGGAGVCSVCKSPNIKPYIASINGANSESNDQVRCPECRELIRFDARKCKHCGTIFDEIKAP